MHIILPMVPTVGASPGNRVGVTRIPPSTAPAAMRASRRPLAELFSTICGSPNAASPLANAAWPAHGSCWAAPIPISLAPVGSLPQRTWLCWRLRYVRRRYQGGWLYHGQMHGASQGGWHDGSSVRHQLLPSPAPCTGVPAGHRNTPPYFRMQGTASAAAPVSAQACVSRCGSAPAEGAAVAAAAAAAAAPCSGPPQVGRVGDTAHGSCGVHDRASSSSSLSTMASSHYCVANLTSGTSSNNSSDHIISRCSSSGSNSGARSNGSGALPADTPDVIDRGGGRTGGGDDDAAVVLTQQHPAAAAATDTASRQQLAPHKHHHHHHCIDPQQQQQQPRLPPPHSGVSGGWWRQPEPGPAGAGPGPGPGSGSNLVPGPGRLQVWWAPLDQDSSCSPDRVERYSGLLSAAEAAEVAASKTPDIAAKRTAARALARCVLARAVTAAAQPGPEPDTEAARGAGADANAGPGVGAGTGADLQLPQQQPTANDGLGRGGGDGEGRGGEGGCGLLAGRRCGPLLVLPKELEFSRSAHGKPHLVTRPRWPELHHNLTHTHDLAGVALFRPPHAASGLKPVAAAAVQGASVYASYGVGLDVERLDRVPRNPLALARRRLAAAEVRDLEALSGEAQARHFMWLWTVKEAYVKARGTGISAPPGLKGFAIGFEDVPNFKARELEATFGGRYRIVPGSLKSITLTHTITGPPSASSAAAGGVSTAHPSKRAVSGTSSLALGGPGGAVAAAAAAGCSGGGLHCGFEGPATHFSFLLFQPTPRHVGALCLAMHPAAAAAEVLRPPLPPKTHGSVAASCPTARGLQEGMRGSAGSHVTLAGAAGLEFGGLRGGLEGRDGGLVVEALRERCGDGWVAAVAASAGAEDSNGNEVQEGRGRSSGGVQGLSGAQLAALVEHWWCVPLEVEGRLGGGELTLLGVSR